MSKQESSLDANIGKISDMIPKMTVDSFSCIKDLEIDFKRLTVFIGEQASGKSVTCKLFYFFTQVFRNVFASSLEERLPFNQFTKKLEKEFHLIFPDSTWQNDPFELTWTVNDKTTKIKHTRSAKKVNIKCDSYKENYELAINGLHKNDSDKKPANLLEDEFNARMWANRFITKTLESLILPSVDYIPAGRSFFSTIQENVFALLSDNIGIDYFLKRFGRKIETHRFRFFRHNPEYSLREFKSILHGVYSYDGKEQWIERDPHHKVRLADASSGQQEVVPLLLILNTFMNGDVPWLRRVVIEEPEAHLFPTAQMEIVDLLRKLMQRTSALGFVITTHSPFILCCLNNLIAKTKSLAGAVSAYHLFAGKGENLYDADLKIINAKRFDSISTEIANGQFVDRV